MLKLFVFERKNPDWEEPYEATILAKDEINAKKLICKKTGYYDWELASIIDMNKEIVLTIANTGF